MRPEQKEEFKQHLGELYAFLKKKLNLKTDPKLFLVEDKENAKKMLGHSGVYDNESKTIQVNITERHPKDCLRTFSHEVVHHWQNENGKLNSKKTPDAEKEDPQYAQNDPKLRRCEQQAYLLGCMYFRDWEDGFKASKEKKSL